jgi:hypothetical protein
MKIVIRDESGFIFPRAKKQSFGLKILKIFYGIQIRSLFDPGSGINIPQST